MEMQAVSTEPAAVAISTLQEANSSFRQEILLAFLFVDVVGILLTYFVAGRALRPLTKLSAKMAQMDENNWNCAMTEPDTHDEIGQVSESFRHLMERLQDSFQAQKHFAANAAHELKTPLAVMKSAIQVLHLEEKPSAEEYEETLELCLETTEQLSQMVEELLVISNPKEEAKEEISLKKMTEEIFQKYAGLIQEKDLVVWQQVQQDTWYTHPVLMRFLLENLLSNAVKYIRQGGSIRLMAEIKENQLHLEVADTGIGISPEHLPTKAAAVELRDITKQFGTVAANDHVSLDIYKGEILALLGENGSGKNAGRNHSGKRRRQRHLFPCDITSMIERNKRIATIVLKRKYSSYNSVKRR